MLTTGIAVGDTYSQINLISNSGFETGSLSSWTKSTGTLDQISVQSSVKQSGSYAAKYYLSTASSGVKHGSLSQSVNFDSAGDTLTIWTYDHASGGTGYTYYTVFIWGNPVGSIPSTSTSDPTWGEWVQHDLDISTACSGSPCTGTLPLEIEIGFGSNHIGDVYVDTTDLESTAPVPGFTATPLQGAAPLSVTFTNSDTHTTAYEWDFGDGGTSTSANPTHSYTSAGNSYTVTHIAKNLGGGVHYTRSNYISTNATLVANFSGTPTSGVAPLSVTFTDSSSGSPAAWNWSFGDGTVSSTQNPTHSYTNAGTYSVRLDVTNPDGTTYLTKSNYISVSGVSAHYGIAIGGRIYDTVSLLGLSTVQMTLVNTTSSWSATTYTNSTGYYAFNNISDSLSQSYVVSGVKSGYLDTATTAFSLTSDEVTAQYADKSFGMEVIGSSASGGTGKYYAPNLVRFTVKYWYGDPIPNVNVTAQGFESTAGSGTLADATTFLGNLFGFDFVTTPIQSTLMVGRTGEDGAITFWMVENVNYHLTFEKNGVQLVSPLDLYPKEYEYPITVGGAAVADQYTTTNSTFSSNPLNATYSYINVSYVDTAIRTTSVKLTIEKIVNATTTTEVYTKSEYGVASANFSGYYFPVSHAGDQYYVTLFTDHLDFGAKNETKLVTIPGRQLDLRLTNTDFYSWIALALIYLIAQIGGGRKTREVAVALTLFSAVMFFAGWLPISTLLLQTALMFAILYYIRTSEDQ
jgi:PKD repeat protein